MHSRGIFNQTKRSLRKVLRARAEGRQGGGGREHLHASVVGTAAVEGEGGY